MGLTQSTLTMDGQVSKNQLLRVLALLLILSIPFSATATAQKPDHLIIGDQEYSLHVNPLEKLFNENEGLRPESQVLSTANWRGYIATFTIENNKLYISELTVSVPTEEIEFDLVQTSVLDTVFPNITERWLDWYSGILVIPQGRRVGYVHLSYASAYEQYLLIRINGGIVQETKQMNNEEYLAYETCQFERYKTTPDYSERYQLFLEEVEDASESEINSFLFDVGTFTDITDVPFDESLDK